MSQDQQPSQESKKQLEVALLLVALLLAWPAFLLGIVSRQLVKHHTDDPFVYWLGAGILGAVSAWFLYAHANSYPFLLLLAPDVGPLVLHLSRTSAMHFALDALPLWERSILLFPWVTLVIELFTPKHLEASLLAQERQRRAIQAKKSQRAARKAAKAPDQISGKAILGALIDNPNE
jgi:hypothetical protein